MADLPQTEPTRQTQTYLVLFHLPGDGARLNLTNRRILELLDIVIQTIETTDSHDIEIVEGGEPIPQGHFAVPVEILSHEPIGQALPQLWIELCIENAFLTAVRWRTRYRRHMIHLVRSRGAPRG